METALTWLLGAVAAYISLAVAVTLAILITFCVIMWRNRY